MKQVTVDIRISAEQFEAYYAGTVNMVQATDSEGRRVRFPARILRPFLQRDGIRGSFTITFDDNRRFQSISRTG